MKNSMMMGLRNHTINVPAFLWQRKSAGQTQKFAEHVRFMTPEHQRVHHFAVRELPALGLPMSPEFIAESLGIPIEQVKAILDDLEVHKTFLFRNNSGEIVWAYPVTVERTPHHLSFSTGEKINAA